MASIFNSIPSQTSHTNNYDPKKTSNESTRSTTKENQENKQETMTSSQENGAVSTSTPRQDSPTSSLTIPTTLPSSPVVPQSVVESIIQQGFPALAKTTKPIPASVFSYRFASSTNNKTPYYISSDIVLSGGIAQQTRRRIVHNEVEKRRKDKINSWITKLAEVIPKCAYGKQSKNIVLENAVDYFTETNKKIQLLEECMENKNTLELENKALTKQVNLLQDQNTKLLELLEKNEISIPECLKATPQVTDTPPKRVSQAESTCVTWSTSGNIPTTTMQSVDIAEKVNPIGQILSEDTPIGPSSGGMTCCVQQAHPNYSIYTVSSIMNGLSQDGVSLVDSNAHNSKVPIETGSISTNDTTTAIPIDMSLGTGNQHVHLNSGAQICVAKGNQTVGLSSANILTATQSCSQGLVPIVHDTSVPQGVTQVVLCQGTVPQSSRVLGPPMVSAAKRTLVTPIVTPNTLTVSQPCVYGSTGLTNNSGLVIQSQGPIMTLGTPSSSTPTHLVGNNTTVLTKDLVSMNTGINSSLQAPRGIAVINPGSNIRTLTAAVAPSSVNGSSVTMAMNKPALGTNSIRSIPVVKVTNNFSPTVNPTTVALAQVVTPGIVNVNVPTIPAGVGTGGIGSMTAPQPSCAPGLVTVNVQAVPTGVGAGAGGTISTQKPSYVTLKLPKTTLQPVCNTSMTSNILTSGTTPTVNLTPSPGTAFVIVRSAPSQQAVTYPTLQTQSVAQSTNFNCVSVASTKIIPSTIVQPTVLQNQVNTGTIQTPFAALISTSTPSVTSTNSLKSLKRNQASSGGSSQPPFKVPKHANAKRRQSNKSSSSSKTKSSKPKKSSMCVPVETRLSTSSCPTNDAICENRTKEVQRSSSNVDICQHDVLTMQNFSISSLIPSISSQNTASSMVTNSCPLTNCLTTSNETRTLGGSVHRTKTTSQGSTTLRLSHSIDSLTGRSDALRQEQAAVHQPPQQQQTLLSFSAESLLGSGDDFVSSLPTISGASASNSSFTSQNTFTISAFQDNSGDGSINQNFSNFSAEALISENDLIGISSDSHSSRTNCAQGPQGVKVTPNRTQMFSDFSAESLISSSDLGSGLSYAIDNLISRSDNNDNSIGMATINPNLLHTTSSNILQDNLNHSMFPHSTAMPVVKNISNNNEYHNTISHTSSDSNITFSKYGGFTSPQKQSKDVYLNKLNGTSYSAITTSPTYLKHSVDSITSSQHNAVTSGSGMFGSALGNTLGAPSFNALYPAIDQMNSQQYQVAGNPFSLCSNLNRPSFQGPTMGSFA